MKWIFVDDITSENIECPLPRKRKSKFYSASNLDENGNTILHLAATKASIETLEILFSLEKNKCSYWLEAENFKGRTPLHEAARGQGEKTF